ncbi:2Fe-2S iron-sulfur cluster-binding protein [Sphingobium fuliginis]|jgi:p-cymene monooxygenase electron transfer component|uniref:2Fe-2S iron-sulfur cluster binding domain-containing protein n=1 Tax=Sphingobium fuliginis (strain ATCC 27551) TaxID=336203 RepID=A0A0A8XA53_SPHSA|nr:2Fe-2S iron-sulfur cluster binding domain-containing protein [Sphingobium fuliginis]QOT74288.1 2Fe-2S iron-sulfur cluster binding domain-containing protein [Sphingobium fuliginis]RYL96527.1 2Fe-2S iron-sulfur cluster binding domain-containing protein [Sphingobium fuliginis]GAM16808.1 reductase component of xylene monooxygenase [Sphingobium fuliginis]GGA00689.1 CDP-6-deoxy-L-threo-D-glycero-4-hexulose-3-dehydrase reductase [Sphingobium fuliginis]
MFSILKKQRSSKVSIAGEPAILEIPRGKTLLEAMLAEGLAMPHDCKVGSCGTCRFKLMDGKIGELSPSALVLERDALSQGYRLACQAMPRSDLVIALDAPLSRQQAVESFTATIVATSRLCPDIINLVVEIDRPMQFSPGQYADLTGPGMAEPRSYSFAFAPERGEAQRLEFHVRHVPGGLFTDWLFGEDRIGQTLDLSGPFGQFRLNDSSAPMLCLAGGSGLAPIMAILQQAQSMGANRPVTLLYGARTRQHLYCLDEIEALSAAWDAPFEFVPVLSEEDAGSDWTGGRGLVTEPIARLPGLTRTEAYLCGPPAMIDAAEAQLIQHGVLPEMIAADRFLDKSTMR